MATKKKGSVMGLYVVDGGTAPVAPTTIANYDQVVYVKSLSFSGEKGMIDANDFDSDDWAETLDGRKSATIEVEANLDFQTTESGQSIIESAFFQEDGEVHFLLTSNVVGSPQLHGRASVSSFSYGAADEEVATISFTLMLRGAPVQARVTA